MPSNQPTERSVCHPTPASFECQRGASCLHTVPVRDRQPDPVRSKFLYGGGVGLVATVLVAVGLAALFDVPFWAALGIAALIGLGLAMLLAVLVG